MINNLSERIKFARIKAGITQGELARKLGIAYPTLNKYERGHRTPDAKLLGRIADVLGCDPGWLLSGEGKDSQRKPDLTPHKTIQTPVLDKVPDSFPDYVSESIIKYINIPDVPREAFALIAKGNSMAPTIRHGDFIFFLQDENIRNGEIIIVKNEWGDSEIKRYQTKNRKIFLVNDNPEYKDVRHRQSYKIIGRVIAVWRKVEI